MIQLSILGSSPAYPNPGSPSSGYLLQSGKTALLVDCGHGVSSALLARIQLSDLTGIVLSHMHPDHFFDLIPLTYAYMFKALAPIPLILPPDGPDVLDRLGAAVGLWEDFFAKHYAITTYEPTGEVRAGDLAVSFCPTRHFVPANAMRIREHTATTGSIFYSSDTAWSEEVVEFARGASLALVEAALDDDASEDDHRGHLTPTEAGRLATAADAQRLVLTHFPVEQGRRFEQEAGDAFSGPVSLAIPGSVYSV